MAQSSDVVLAQVIELLGPHMVPAGRDPTGQETFTHSNVVVRLRLLAAWKGARTDTLSLMTESGGGDCGYEFILGGVYLIYGQRDPGGGIHTSICSRTAPIERAREDSLALGPPPFDRLGGRTWASYGPPASCPVHAGIPIRIAHAWYAFDLTPEARRAYPAWSRDAVPFAGMPLAPDERGGSLPNVYVCPLCRELALAWVGVSQERSTGPERLDDLPRPEARPRLEEAAYRRAFPRGNFAVKYGDGRQEYDSIPSRFTRTFGVVWDTNFKLELSAGELDRLYETSVAARLFEIETPHPPYPAATAEAIVRADRACELSVRCGVEIRLFRWYQARAARGAAADSPWGRLESVYRAVQRTIADRPEVLALTPIPLDLDDPLRESRGR